MFPATARAEEAEVMDESAEVMNEGAEEEPIVLSAVPLEGSSNFADANGLNAVAGWADNNGAANFVEEVKGFPNLFLGSSNNEEADLSGKPELFADENISAASSQGSITIVFEANYGYGAMAPIVVPVGQSFTLPECGFGWPAGKYFAYWANGNGSETSYFSPGTEFNTATWGAGTYSFRAVWFTRSSETCYVPFNAGGGQGYMAPKYLSRGQTFTLPQCTFAPPAGKRFSHWTIEGTGERFNVGTKITAPNEPDWYIPFTAVWMDCAATDVVIQFDASGGWGGSESNSYMSSLVLPAGQSFVLPDCGFFYPEGSYFAGWTCNSNMISAGSSLSGLAAGTYVFSAVWRTWNANTAPMYFNAGGGSGYMYPTTAQGGSFYEIPECTFAPPAGKRFKCWSWNGYYNNQPWMFYSNEGTSLLIADYPNAYIMYTAVWEDVPNNYATIRFNARGGMNEYMPAVSIPNGADFILPECWFTPMNGKYFYGWNDGSTIFAPGTRLPGVGAPYDYMFKASWFSLSANTLTIIFNANGGYGEAMDRTVKSGGSFYVPECRFYPPAGKHFAGWADPSGQVFQPNTSVPVASTASGAVTFYALWENNDYTSPTVPVYFYAGGGSGGMSTQYAAAGMPYYLPQCTFTPPAGTRFRFWATPMGNYPEYYPLPVGTSSLTLTAVWENISGSSYTVTFNANGGQVLGASTKTVTYNQPYGELPVPRYTGSGKYMFAGWYTDPTGGTEITALSIVDINADHTLYARWVKLSTVIPPAVVTGTASNISKNSATLSGTLTDSGGSETPLLQFVYWNQYESASRYLVNAAGSGSFTATINNLAPSSTYYYYAKASNSVGEGVGNIRSFTTEAEEQPVSVSVSPSYLSLRPGETSQLLASVLPVGAANRNVLWSSSNNQVVTVDANGRLRAVASGTASITATTEANRLTAVCTVAVTAGVPAADLQGVFDFSEANLNTNCSNVAVDGFDFVELGGGGNYAASTAYLARWDGAVLETGDPYPGPNATRFPSYREIDADYHVQEVLWLPERADNNALDNNEIKSAIMNYGGIYVAYNHYDQYFNPNYASYYDPYDDPGGNHAVTLVGWDDDYPAANFNIRPQGNGAFICKNSWGTGFGDQGYFYVSYYDRCFGRRGLAVYPSIERNTNYNKIYQYDPLGAISALSAPGTIYAANVFPQRGSTLTANETLRAVSFYTYHKNTSYEVYIVQQYKDSTSLANKGVAVAAGSIRDMGYHTISLSQAVGLERGTRFAVIVKLSVADGSSGFYYEAPIRNYSGKARANADESYVSSDSVNWQDLTKIVDNANFCIKAFTDNGQAAYSAELFAAVDNDDRVYESDKVYTLDEALAIGMDLNPDYIEWTEQVELMAAGDNYGNTPPVTNTGDNTISFAGGSIFPSYYDLRRENTVTSVKDQNPYGTCWTFATYGSLESCLMKKAKSVDSSTLSGSPILDAIAGAGQGSAVTGLKLSKTYVRMAVGTTYALSVSFEPANATGTVTWKSDNPRVATVDTNGIITAVSIGTTFITAKTANGISPEICQVVVSAGKQVTGILLTQDSITCKVGNKFAMGYTISPSDAADKSVTWSSNRPDIVSVNAYGSMEAKSAGTAAISVTTTDGNYTATLAVEVKENSGLNGSDGLTITSLIPEFAGNSVNIALWNPLGASGTIAIHMAAYNADGKMLNSWVRPWALTSNTTQYIHLDQLAINGLNRPGYRLKCFLLDSGTLKPIAASMVVG